MLAGEREIGHLPDGFADDFERRIMNPGKGAPFISANNTNRHRKMIGH